LGGLNGTASKSVTKAFTGNDDALLVVELADGLQWTRGIASRAASNG
jgi:hypothetical protein